MALVENHPKHGTLAPCPLLHLDELVQRVERLEQADVVDAEFQFIGEADERLDQLGVTGARVAAADGQRIYLAAGGLQTAQRRNRLADPRVASGGKRLHGPGRLIGVGTKTWQTVLHHAALAAQVDATGAAFALQRGDQPADLMCSGARRDGLFHRPQRLVAAHDELPGQPEKTEQGKQENHRQLQSQWHIPKH